MTTTPLCGLLLCATITLCSLGCDSPEPGPGDADVDAADGDVADTDIAPDVDDAGRDTPDADRPGDAEHPDVQPDADDDEVEPPLPRCGNGILEPRNGEACDGKDFGDATCSSSGFDGGSLGCSHQCERVLDACWPEPTRRHFVDRDSIGGTCSDSGAGTEAEPFCTLAAATAMALPGELVTIRAGVYTEPLAPTASGTVDGRIVFASMEGEEVVIRGAGANPIAVELDVSHVQIHGISVDVDEAPAATHQNVRIRGSHNIVSEVRIINAGDFVAEHQAGRRETGIAIVGGDSNLIQGCTATGMSAHALSITREDNNIAQRNVVCGNTLGFGFGDSVLISSSLANLSGNMLDGNVIAGSTTSDGLRIQGNPESADPENDISNQGIVVRNNTIYGNAANGIELSGACYILIEGNWIYGNIGNQGGGLGPGGDNRDGGVGGFYVTPDRSARRVIVRRNVFYDNRSGAAPPARSYFYNNTVLGNNRDYTGSNSAFDAPRAFVGVTLSQRTAFVNNIVAGHNGAELFFPLDGAMLIDHNLYGAPEGISRFLVETADGTETFAFVEWSEVLESSTTVTGADAASLEGSPLFQSSSIRPLGSHLDHDWRLDEDSPAVDGGGFLSLAASAGSGSSLVVTESGFFFDGYGLVDGDLIQIGERTARVISADYASDTLVLDESIEWEEGAGIALAYEGSAPDIGAFER